MNITFDRWLLVTLSLFGVASFVSIAGANVFLGLSTLLLLIVSIKNKEYSIADDKLPYFKALAVFAGALFISALFSGNVGYGLKTWGDFFLWRFMPFVIIVSLFDDKFKAEKLLRAVMCGFLIDCLYAIYQGAFVYKLNIAHGRAAGFVGHPMTLAGWECILLPVLLVYIYRKDITKTYKWFYVVLFSLFIVALIFNSTRGAWLALAIALPLVSLPFILKSKKSFIAFVSVVALISTALISSPSFMKRVDSISDTGNWSNASRFIIWETAYGMFKEHPVLGVGLGQFKPNFQSRFVDDDKLKKQVEEYRSYHKNLKQKKLTPAQKNMNKLQVQALKQANRRAWENKHLRGLTHAHNNIMQMLGENGLTGFFGYVFAFGFILWKNIKNYLMNKNPYALMIVGSTIALILQGLTEYNFGNSSVMKIYWFVLACLVILAGCYNKENAEEKS